MQTLLEILKKTAEFLAKKEAPNPRLEAELLIGHALGLKRMQLYLQFERPLTEPELEKLRPLVRRRAAREPLAYIVGDTEFFGLKLKTDRRALVPRPETEQLAELLVERRKATPPAALLDLGTGGGALALALATAFPQATALAVDRSEEALALARENCVLHGLAERVLLRRSNWFSALTAGETFDLIVSNPPYLSDGDVAEAEPEVREHEPRAALVAGEDGLADLRAILGEARPRLRAGGLLALETGIDQHAALAEIARAAGYGRTESLKDYSGRDRFFFAE